MNGRREWHAMMKMILGFPLGLSASDLNAWHGQLVRVSIALAHKYLYEFETLTPQDGAAACSA